MRDDFASEVKHTLAARVGNLCSNPECRALTGGPQDDPAKAVNIAVVAHITGAAPGGPRYDAALLSEQGCDADNGIWLCQIAQSTGTTMSRSSRWNLTYQEDTCGHHARFVLGKTLSPPRPESDAERKMRKILEWKGKVVTLAEMTTGSAVMMLGPKRGSTYVVMLDCTEHYVTVVRMTLKHGKGQSP